MQERRPDSESGDPSADPLRAHWDAFYRLHRLVFAGMLRRLVRAAERAAAGRAAGQ